MDGKADIMVVSPHPDDAEFGVSGTVIHWVRDGKKIVYVICSSGEKGTSDLNVKPEDLARTREREQQDAASFLGVSEVVFLRYPDQGLEDTPEFRKDIVRQIRTFRPDIVVTADPYRRYIWHRDHRITGRVVLDAVFPYARDHLSYPDLMSEGITPHKVKEVWLWASEDPNYTIDITDSFETKIAALNCHKSQVGKRLDTDMRNWLTERAREMAQGKGFELGEAFHRVEIMW